MDDTDQSHKDRWWKWVLEQVRAHETQATAAPRMVAFDQLSEPPDPQATKDKP
jgi:hypothetical protein